MSRHGFGYDEEQEKKSPSAEHLHSERSYCQNCYWLMRPLMLELSALVFVVVCKTKVWIRLTIVEFGSGILESDIYAESTV